MVEHLVSFLYSIGYVGNPNVVAIRVEDGGYRPQRRVFGTDAAKAHLANTTNYGIYPLVNRVFPLTALRKISIGFFLTAAGFAKTA